VAEHEAAMISARTKAALAAAKAHGTVLGGNRGNIASEAGRGAKASATVRSAKAGKRAADLLPVIEAIRAEGAMSLREVAAALNGRNIPAARGGEWSAVQVKRVLAT
jgi:DNA invertase Pin-like site-specific DNA recombinase